VQRYSGEAARDLRRYLTTCASATGRAAAAADQSESYTAAAEALTPRQQQALFRWRSLGSNVLERVPVADSEHSEDFAVIRRGHESDQFRALASIAFQHPLDVLSLWNVPRNWNNPDCVVHCSSDRWALSRTQDSAS